MAAFAHTFRELALGVQALHHAGILHRDLKPTNVLVAGERVVLLDFGLARELGEQSLVITAEGTIAGTPAYMAPEQAAEEKLSEATDWYAFGVMLYEALGGMLPFEAGDILELLTLKLSHDYKVPELDPEVPVELRRLCSQLLARDPKQRPHGDEVLTILGALATPQRDRKSMPGVLRAGEHDQLVGRGAELEKLRAAVQRAERDSVAVHVRGSSGSGKSALIDRLLTNLQRPANTQTPVVLLHSRCYERESMPFKALDGVVDALVKHLSKLSEVEVAFALPSGVSELAQLFPTFERHPTISRLLAERKVTGDATQVRQQAELALRELMTRLGKRALPVIVIDDLHWGDLDSAYVIDDWLRRPIVPLLLILSYRSEEVATSPSLQVILDTPRPLPPSASKELWVELSPLSGDDVRELCRTRRESQKPLPEHLVERIACEARGSPFLAQQLTALAHARLARGERDMSALSLRDMSNERAVPLLRLAASHFIRSGRFAEGDVLVQKVLRSLHLDVPSSTRSLMAAIAWELARQTLRGERFEPHDGPETLEARKHGLLYVTLGIETLIYAPVRAVLFQARALRCAYASGDPALLASTLCLTATMSCISGTARAAKRAESLITRAAALTRDLRARNVRCEFELHWARTICSMMLGRPAAVIDAAHNARAIYESEPDLGEHGEYFYMFAIHAAHLGSLANLGQYKLASQELAQIRENARASDNRTALLLLSLPTTMVEQMTQECAPTRQRLQTEREQLPRGEFSVLHLQHLLSTLRAACITGDFAWAMPILAHDWPRYLQSQTHRSAYMAYAAHTTHARLLLNQYARDRNGDPVRAVSEDLNALSRLPPSHFTLGSLCRHRARLANFRSERQLAISLLRQSVAAFSAAGFVDETQFDRYALGELLADAEGAQLMAESLRELTALGCNDPIANLRGYYPELRTVLR